MSEVFLCKTGALKPRAIRDLRKAGIVVVETDEPKDCQFIRSTEIVSGSEMLMAAITAIHADSSYGLKVHEVFVSELFKAVTRTHHSGD